MRYIRNNSVIKNTIARLLISLSLPCAFVSLQAFTTSNDIEMMLALAAIPFDMAAQDCTLKNAKKKAAILHLTTDALHILHKAFFLYNRMNIPCEKDMPSWYHHRDRYVICALILRDVSKSYQHFHEYMVAFDESITVVPEEATYWLPLDEQTVSPHTPNGLSQAAYTWQVKILPILKGISAFALAVTQESLYTAHACYLATAAHSLVSLLDEYTMLEAESPYKKVLITALLINAVWVAKELEKRMPTSESNSDSEPDGDQTHSQTNNNPVNPDEHLGKYFPQVYTLLSAGKSMQDITEENPYAVLGVDKDADMTEIKREWRRLSLKCHPDKITGNTEAQKYLNSGLDKIKKLRGGSI